MTIVPLDDHRDTPPVLSRRTPAAQVLADAEDYWRIANRLASTEFVPTALRKRPEAVLACILSGVERGLGLMESLRSIHVIEGRPTLSAEAMRALVFAAGHTIDIIESTATKATVVGRRADSETTSPPFTWTLDRARRARLANKQNWQTYPEAMLLARATADLCRALFPDVIAGLAVTEELADDSDDTAVPSTSRRTPPPRRRQLPARPAAAEPTAGDKPAKETRSNVTPPAPLDVDDIPGADRPSWAPAPPPPAQAQARATATPAAFIRRLNAELNKAFPDTDKPTRDRYRHALVACITRHRDTGPITTSTELTEAEQMATSKAMLNIVAGTASITDGPDGTIELRGERSYTVTLDPLTVTAHTDDEHQADEQPTLDDTEDPT